jgi:hypothetical protein
VKIFDEEQVQDLERELEDLAENLNEDEFQGDMGDVPEVEEENEEEEVYAPDTPRPISIVPLADSGKSPAEEKAEFEQNQQEQAREQFLQREDTQVRFAEDTSKLEKQIHLDTIREIPKQRAAEIKKNLVRDATLLAKEEKKLQKTIDKSGVFNEEHESNCRIMNLYRDKYRGKINYNFRSNYHTGLDYMKTKQERKDFETILYTQDVPTLIKDMIKKVAGSLEAISLALNWPLFDLSELEYKVEVNVDSGSFDEEIEQIVIKWSEYFSRSPEERLGGKLFMVVSKTLSDNFKRKKGVNIRPPPPISKERMNRTNDL